ncbi:MAG: hypothetical protein WB561_03150 [Terracidiphilus sp.]
MRRQTVRVTAAVLFPVLAIPAFGQIAKSTNQPSHPVKPIPVYTAEFKTVNVQTLADGTTITTETKEIRARDSQNRNLFVTTRKPPAAGIEVTSGNINNPVDNTETNWNSQNKKATITRLPPLDQRYGCWASDSRHMTINYGSRATTTSPGTVRQGLIVGGESQLVTSVGMATKQEEQREDLGTANIQGLEAKGERVTTVIPMDKVGNDKPITTTREVWRAPGLPFALREVYNDPRSGTRTRETVSLTIGEPDLSLFQPPEGYEVVTEEMHDVPCQQ